MGTGTEKNYQPGIVQVFMIPSPGTARKGKKEMGTIHSPLGDLAGALVFHFRKKNLLRLSRGEGTVSSGGQRGWNQAFSSFVGHEGRPGR